MLRPELRHLLVRKRSPGSGPLADSSRGSLSVCLAEASRPPQLLSLPPPSANTEELLNPNLIGIFHCSPGQRAPSPPRVFSRAHTAVFHQCAGNMCLLPLLFSRLISPGFCFMRKSHPGCWDRRRHKEVAVEELWIPRWGASFGGGCKGPGERKPVSPMGCLGIGTAGKHPCCP